MSFPQLPRWAYAVLAAAAIGMAATAIPWFAAPRVDVIEASPRKIRQTVVVSGRVLTPATVAIGSTITGRVVSVDVDEGERVAARQVLIELDRAELAASLKTAEAQEGAARTRILQWRETGLPASKQALIQAEAIFVDHRGQGQRKHVPQHSSACRHDDTQSQHGRQTVCQHSRCGPRHDQHGDHQDRPDRFECSHDRRCRQRHQAE